MSQNCECSKPAVEIPVRGGSLKLDMETFGNPAPNLQFGVETKRNMFYNGKQVYSQLIYFGNLPSSSTSTTKKIQHNIPDVEWIQVDPAYTTVLRPNGEAYASSRYQQTTLVSKTEVGFAIGGNQSANVATLCLIYTKTSDPVIG